MNNSRSGPQFAPVTKEKQKHRVSADTRVRSVYNGAPPFSELINDQGVSWLEYRRTLGPHYGRAWRDTIFCFLMLFSGFALHMAANARWGNITGLLTVPVVAIWVGFWLHALNQFAHEGTHGNLARDRKWNDFLTDWLLWPLYAQTLRSYRRSHMQHHVHLGDHLDTEINYHECMDPWFLVKGLTGIQMLAMVLRYVVKPKAAAAADMLAHKDNNSQLSKAEMLTALARTALIHGVLIGVPACFGLFGSAAGWLLGMAAIYPCIGTTRQILEHRAYDAACETDFTEQEHGPINRLFGDDWFSRYFGAAGLNRHLLHHWDPAISYTRLADMEAFMLRTTYRRSIEKNRTTYLRAARQMFKKRSR